MDKVNSTTYNDVVARAEQLTRAEQISLANHLREIIGQRGLTSDEWNTLADSITVSVPAGAAFSDRREDWYGDDER